MKRTSEEYKDHILRKMIVDWSIDQWQSIQCAIVSIEEGLELLEEFKDHPSYLEKRLVLEEAKKLILEK